MKLDFHRMGQKLFFVTFAVEGRRPVLSRLVDEKSRPQLLPMGEVVRAALRALHLVRASAGISDYVIMPDHVHFIMRVDCDRDKIASPLWLTHRVLDAVECAVRDGFGEPTGAAAPAPPPWPVGGAGGIPPSVPLAPPASSEIDPAIMARYLQAACDADDAAHGYAPLGGGVGGAPPRRFPRHPPSLSARPTLSSPSTRGSSRPSAATSGSTPRASSGAWPIPISSAV